MIKRPHIPLPMKRAVRQRCGFGCVICGSPVYHIDHMKPYSEEREHEEVNLTLLCPNHHEEKTKGLLPLAVVQEANLDPVNIKNGITTPYKLHYGRVGHECSVLIGSGRFTMAFDEKPKRMQAVVVDRTPLLMFELLDGHVYVSMALFDRFNQMMVLIDSNELVFTTAGWDYEFSGSTLVVRTAMGEVAAAIEFRPPAEIWFKTGELLLNGTGVRVNGGVLEIVTPGATISQSHMQYREMHGIVLGPSGPFVAPTENPIEPAGMRWERIDRVSDGGPG